MRLRRVFNQIIFQNILCKSHVCEKFDNTNIATLASIESLIGLRQQIEKRNGALKSFLRQKKSVVADAVIPALLKLVATVGDGKTSSLADEFSLILEEDGIYKIYSLYKERRFAKLGYTAGAIYESLPQFKKLLERTSRNNLLVRACNLYLESDLIIAGLKSLSNFTYHITMPFLNCVERVDLNVLRDIIPKLFETLKSGSLRRDALAEYQVKWTHANMDNQKLTSDLDHYLLKVLCKTAVEGFELQCAREYWSKDDNTRRATALHQLTQEERSNLPTNNCFAERHFAKFGMLASQSASHSNKFFKGKRIRDDLMLDDKEGPQRRFTNC